MGNKAGESEQPLWCAGEKKGRVQVHTTRAGRRASRIRVHVYASAGNAGLQQQRRYAPAILHPAGSVFAMPECNPFNLNEPRVARSDGRGAALHMYAV